MSLKLFSLTMGSIERFAVAADYEEMYEKRATIEPSFEYTPVIIEEVTVPGFDIVVYPEDITPKAIESKEELLNEVTQQFEEDHAAIEQEEAPAEEPKELTPEEEAAHAILELPFDIETATKAEMTEYLKSKNIGVKSNATVAYLQELVINSLV